MTEERGSRPRVLVTGFSSFPGVPENPTEALVHALQARGSEIALHGEVRCETLAVEYCSLPQRLEELGRSFAPDIALHFGISGAATTFTIETLARNRVGIAKPDNAGYIPTEELILAEGVELASSLPTQAIMDALAARGLPASRSEDAGDYLCNYLFYLSRGGHHPPFAPTMAGFIHVPPFGATLDNASRKHFSLPMLIEGALATLAVCSEAWRASHIAESESKLCAGLPLR